MVGPGQTPTPDKWPTLHFDVVIGNAANEITAPPWQAGDARTTDITMQSLKAHSKARFGSARQKGWLGKDDNQTYVFRDEHRLIQTLIKHNLAKHIPGFTGILRTKDNLKTRPPHLTAS
eukprot:scaffold20612_cov23-Prasinocladus_malaysianus.AAC.1